MTGSAGVPMDVDARLVEEAVLRAVRGHRLEPRYRSARERCYAIADAERREAAFRALESDFLGELGLVGPIRRALAARPALLARLARVAVARAPSADAEGADLFAPPGKPAGGIALGLAVTATTLADPSRLEALLATELVHVEDLLDPAFGFRPGEDVPGGASPVRRERTRQRYRLLWRVSVDGRVSRGKPEREAARRRCGTLLRRAFGPDETRIEELLRRLFDSSRPSHAELIALADPPDPAGPAGGPGPGDACPLCRFPSHRFEPVSALGEPARDAIRGDFPGWSPAPVCLQCADLYRARAGSLAAGSRQR